MKHPTAPCHDCPFSRAVKPGTLGGSEFTVYVGQTIGPFILNCHTADGYRHKQTRVHEVAQCAGAAIFRANLGVDKQMPHGIHRLPEDRHAVFGDHAEFIAHHLQVPIYYAHTFLRCYPAEEWLERELHDPQAREA